MSKQRKLPRHVDARVMVFMIPARRFFRVVLPVMLIILFITLFSLGKVNKITDLKNEELRIQYEEEKLINENARFVKEKSPAPLILFVGIIIMGTWFIMFCEIGKKETTFEILKTMLHYRLEGDQYFERSSLYVDECERFIQNNIKKEKSESSC